MGTPVSADSGRDDTRKKGEHQRKQKIFVITKYCGSMSAVEKNRPRKITSKTSTMRSPYRFVGSGLPNVYVVGVEYEIDREPPSNSQPQSSVQVFRACQTC